MCVNRKMSLRAQAKKSVAYFLGRRDRKQLVVSTHCAGRLSALLPLGNCLQTVYVCVSVYKYLCVCVCVHSLDENFMLHSGHAAHALLALLTCPLCRLYSLNRGG